MAKKKAIGVTRKGRVSSAETERLKKIREQAQQDFPPDPDRPRPATHGIGAKIRAARESQGLTWYAVAKAAGIPNPATVRDIEYGRDGCGGAAPVGAQANSPRLEPGEPT